MAIRVGMVSLGCPKNQVDGELLLASIQQSGYQLVADPANCDVVLINTCGFIQSAKEEAIENILEMVALKNAGRIQKIIVTGCLAERYQDEIISEIPEVDAVVGIGANSEIADILRQTLDGQKSQHYREKEHLSLSGMRILTNAPYYAYLKIAEGCDHCCSYCAIPNIRGRFRSRPMQELMDEAEWLAKQGVKELILVAQDTTCYGKDLYGEYALSKLLNQLCKIDQFRWIRVLYCYPDKITDQLIEVFQKQDKVVKYLDIPLQHANDEILQKMNRPVNKAESMALITKLREQIPDLTIRTTLIAGFPTETEQQFEELAQFVKDMQFDRLGCFAYSEEEGTAAVHMTPQVPEEQRRHRADIIMHEQMNIQEQQNQQKIGTTFTVLTEGYDDFAACFFGRSQADAPDIDGKVFFTSEQKHTIGDFVEVQIVDVYHYDLWGKIKSQS